MIRIQNDDSNHDFGFESNQIQNLIRIIFKLDSRTTLLSICRRCLAEGTVKEPKNRISDENAQDGSPADDTSIAERGRLRRMHSDVAAVAAEESAARRRAKLRWRRSAALAAAMARQKAAMAEIDRVTSEAVRPGLPVSPK